MMHLKDYLICILVVLIIILGGAMQVDAADLSVSSGQATRIHSINHTHNGDSYSMKSAALRLKSNWEFSLVEHEYDIDDANFTTMSVGAAYHWVFKPVKWGFIDLGLGFRYAEKDRRIKWLMHKHLVADFSGSVGVEYKGLKLAYTLRHFSCPGSDTGMNLDEFTFTINYQF